MSKPKRKTQIFAIALFLTSLHQVIFSVGKVISGGKLVDFEIYYTYTKMFLSGNNPYAQNVPLNYPPSALLFFTSFSLLSQKTPEVVFTTLSIIALLTSLYLLTKPSIKSLSWKLIIIALMLQSFPVKFTLGMGQINLIVLFFLSLAFINDQKNKQTMAGIYWGMAMMIKLIPCPLIIYFLVRKKLKTAAVGLTLLLSSNLAMLYFYPGMLKYFQTILPYLSSPVGKGISIYDQSLRAFFMRLGLPQSYELSIFIGIILIILAVNKYRKDHHDLTFYSLIIAITTIINSFAWQHHFVFVFPLLIAGVIMKLGKTRGNIGWFLLALSFILISFHFPNPATPSTTNPILISHTLIGTLILIGFCLNFKA